MQVIEIEITNYGTVPGFHIIKIESGKSWVLILT